MQLQTAVEKHFFVFSQAGVTIVKFVSFRRNEKRQGQDSKSAESGAIYGFEVPDCWHHVRT
ncbi:hypothetical protein OHAE_1297 [Ochrobactrum soli]|uniref:Uncharacterized protein n=1 Tax=Ochrobactrum soli TaxID=2448455 RepID=A0A2P9HNM9_9HYPH|nr:hypothetical protein OHAE_1297 [[Ochrobactrum] soli]